ncbi:NAD(P)-dependent dehydrogenase (short-subunit alcohol dehydrogenase family) [Phyllobacterium ifriqiyense]|uniref:NAD(P)-dependent dehydrogenase (Short-subunit alcohol dehydrogenase family) n=1 Tax=Phyllobacterium ifriqiyense TaxID=314238 RepID=A0ABU0S927_9HYPH|nr:SDR family NAD(P)-dependent oxidoreductase [Phyllobacterium ifriqiyense]MDQ0997263.1 NAD(P)-dependent dehydrogenase (short-subunit alcohol dehydrogenase family) [Phyllobacterium ifriqiyense]
MNHPALSPSCVAVISGGASGIGLAAAKRFAGLGMKVAIADLGGERLEQACREVADLQPAHPDAVIAVATDVTRPDDLRNLKQIVDEKFGQTDILMNNAGIQPGSSVFDGSNWDRIIATNLMAVVHGCQIFGPSMIKRQTPGLIINTGSKQGITTPPGDPAYNVSKSGVKTFTEALQHELRNTKDCHVTAHLFIPGFVYTALTKGDRVEKPAGAWTPEQTVDFMLESVAAGDFYILCPDNDVTRALDEKRILWAANDIIQNRPPLSRWHPDFESRFANFLKQNA